MRHEIFLLILVSSAFALIDPPVTEVYNHDLSIAPQGLLSYNALNLSEKEPTLDDPTEFYYVKILTLTPSVAMTINSEAQPSLIWLAAEGHNRTVDLKQVNGDCGSYERKRSFGDARLENVTAYYTLDGILHDEGGNYTFLTVNQTQILASNGSFQNPVAVPFQRNPACSLAENLLGFMFGQEMDLSCNEESLFRASPYPNGTINLTHRDAGLMNPRLNVSLDAVLAIDYDEYWHSCQKDTKGCECDSGEDNGTLLLPYHDNQSYEVQNDRMTMLVYSPDLEQLDANTSQDVVYHVSLLSTADLYKYYSVMDNGTASAYYVRSFDVVNDSYGTQFIISNVTNHSGLLPEDPMALDNYTGAHSLDSFIWGMALRSPTEFNNRSYNYSRVYDIKDTFETMAPGAHQARLEFFTYFGNYTALSNVSVRLRTNLTLQVVSYGGGQVMVLCALTGNGSVLAGQEVELNLGDENRGVVTDGSGSCSSLFDYNTSFGTVYATYPESSVYLPSIAQIPFSTGVSFNLGGSLISNNFALLLILSSLLAFSFLGMARSAGGAPGLNVAQFYSFAPSGIPKAEKTVRVKKGNELAVSVAMAVTAGGAGAAAGAKVGEEAARKKMMKDAAQKEMDKKVKQAMAESEGKKSGKGVKKKCGDSENKHVATEIGAKRNSMKKQKHDPSNRTLLDIFRRSKSENELLDMMKSPEDRKKFAGMIKILTHDMELDRMANELDVAARHINRHDLASTFRARVVHYHISDDFPFNALMLKDSPSDPSPGDTHALTVMDERGITVAQRKKGEHYYDIYLRESRTADKMNLLADALHEKDHPYTALPWDDAYRGRVEGCIELQTYKRILQHESLTPEEKATYSIVGGRYRDFAAAEYLVENIIGHDHWIVGHYIEGVEHLRTQFDSVAGKGKYDKIFNAGLNDRDKIEALKKIHRTRVALTSDDVQFVENNVKKITDEGKYEIR